MSGPPSLEVLLPLFGDVEQCQASITSVLHQSCEASWLTITDDCYPEFQARAHAAPVARSAAISMDWATARRLARLAAGR